MVWLERRLGPGGQGWGECGRLVGMKIFRLAMQGLVVGMLGLGVGAGAGGQEAVVVDASAPTTPFPHFWEKMFGSGRANLMLRESWREDLKAVHGVTGFTYVRAHGILHDENGVYTEDEHGNAVYNFAYVNQIYDGLLKNGVKPVVEISFMPKKLAFNPDALHPFWYKHECISAEEYGAVGRADEGALRSTWWTATESMKCLTWYFEVWNEPNIDFWNGIPKDWRATLELYAHTARTLKSVNPRIRVGGPATAAAHWVPDTFLKLWTKADNKVPVDFVSTATDTPMIRSRTCFPNDPT